MRVLIGRSFDVASAAAALLLRVEPAASGGDLRGGRGGPGRRAALLHRSQAHAHHQVSLQVVCLFT